MFARLANAELSLGRTEVPGGGKVEGDGERWVEGRGGGGAVPDCALSPPKWFCIIMMGSYETSLIFH